MKNLYQILGVLDTAEDIVIRAAYKALAQKYHPDKWSGDVGEATLKMGEINDAYRILSDPIEKAKYDKTLNKKEYQEEPEVEENIDAYLEDAWKVGLIFFPKLEELYLHLRKTNYALGNTFKLIVIENKAFADANAIAKDMEMEFLKKYFGENKNIIEFAKDLIKNGSRKGVITLNKYINILGNSVDSNLIIDKVCVEANFQQTIVFDAIRNYERNKTVANGGEVLQAFGWHVSSFHGRNEVSATKGGLTYFYSSSNIDQYIEKLIEEFRKINYNR